MAIARPGSIVAAISGTLGAVNFRNARHALVITPATRRVDSFSPAQATQRAALQRAAAAWRNLTDDQRRSWRTAAAAIPISNRLGTHAPRSAFRWFVYLRTLGQGSEASVYVDPPVMNQTTAITSCAFTADAVTGVELNLVLPQPPTQSWFLVYGSRSHSLIPPTTWRSWRWLGKWPQTAQPIDLTPTWIAALGSLSTGEYVALRIRRRWGVTLVNSPFHAQTAVTP